MAKKGEETRQKLILAALDLFHEKGIHWVSFQQVASRLGISQAALYKYFSDKDDLILACASHATKEGRAYIDKQIDPSQNAKERLRSYIEANFKWVATKPKEGAAIAALYYFGLNSPKVGQLLAAVNQGSEERLSILLSHGNHERSWQIRKIPALARVIHDVLIGEMMKIIHSPRELPISKRMEICWEAVEAILSCK